MFKKIILLLTFISFCSFSQNRITLIPEIIQIDNYLIEQSDTLKIKEINDGFYDEILRKNKIPQCKIDSIKTYNFNGSQSLYFAYWSCGDPHDYFDIYIDDKNGLNEVGKFNVYSSHFAEIKNGIPQIVQTYYEGHKTNPIYFTKTYAYNGTEYEVIQNDHLKLGEYRDLGLEAYRDGDYQTAYICFQNVLRPVWHTGRINPIDYNNLALVFIKTNKYSKADDLLHKALTLKRNEDITFFNLGLLHENQRNTLQAIEYYHKSNYIKPSKDIDDKLKILYNIFLEFNSFPYGFLEEMKTNETVMGIISEFQFERISYLSETIISNKTMLISEEKYLTLSDQRKIILAIKNDKNIDLVSKYIILDRLIQYYFMTYYYYFCKPNQKDFKVEDKKFIDTLGIEYKWNEQSACNIYLHTYLKKILNLKEMNNKWIEYYRKLYQQNKFDDYPKGD